MTDAAGAFLEPGRFYAESTRLVKPIAGKLPGNSVIRYSPLLPPERVVMCQRIFRKLRASGPIGQPRTRARRGVEPALTSTGKIQCSFDAENRHALEYQLTW